jgi:hypothetical protein
MLSFFLHALASAVAQLREGHGGAGGAAAGALGAGGEGVGRVRDEAAAALTGAAVGPGG